MRLFHKLLALTAIFAASLALARPAMAWSTGFHRLIGKLAYGQLTLQAKRAFARLVLNYSMPTNNQFFDEAQYFGSRPCSNRKGALSAAAILEIRERRLV